MKIKKEKIIYIILFIILLSIIFLLFFPKSSKQIETTKNLTNQIKNLSENKELINVNTVRPKIEKYLLSQKDFSWQTTENSHSFCSFTPLNKVNEVPLYIWVRCSEFKVKNNKLIEKSGISVPVKITKNEKDNYSHWIPRDGADYQKDLEKEFPAEVLSNIKELRELYLVNLNYELIRQLKDYYQNEDLELPSSLIQNCEQNEDCILPFDYAIRSSCPYATRCIDNKCEVYCPWEKK